MSYQELTEIIKLLGERIIKIEKTLLHHSTKLKTMINIKSFSNLEKPIDILENNKNTNKISINNLEKRLEILENNLNTNKISRNTSNLDNTNYKEKIDDYIEKNIKRVKEEQLKLYNSQIKLNKNIELLETTITAFSQKIKLY